MFKEIAVGFISGIVIGILAALGSMVLKVILYLVLLLD